MHKMRAPTASAGSAGARGCLPAQKARCVLKSWLRRHEEKPAGLAAVAGGATELGSGAQQAAL
eukprot:CAMPEP_0195065926 /NCGR_PEP_ID=MMETSP0448-20130528/11428_1 /TAXON_ID=66468 /ORGANISM="Heterocapsa triquestra, Strain CCMP 448" /LENGTH=62 /DNA_ID=CAMNT_0040097089 /DNA_START=17 /DNA_END=202 /DNA_ORIENTATION=-